MLATVYTCAEIKWTTMNLPIYLMDEVWTVGIWPVEVNLYLLNMINHCDPGPVTLLESPSKESYEKKLDFERSRISEWLL